MTKAAGQTRHRSSTPTADHGERAVYGAFLEPVNRADRGPSNRMHMSRHDRGDDLMDRGAVQTREIFQLANEAKFEECIPQPVSMAVGCWCSSNSVRRGYSRGGVRCRDRHRGEGEREGDGGRSGGVDPSLSRSAS